MIPPRLDATVAPATPAGQAIPAADGRQAALQRALSSLVGLSVPAQVMSKLQDGSYLVKVADNAVRMQLPAGTEVGAELPLTVIAASPRPTFQLGGARPPGTPPLVYSDAEPGLLLPSQEQPAGYVPGRQPAAGQAAQPATGQPGAAGPQPGAQAAGEGPGAATGGSGQALPQGALGSQPGAGGGPAQAGVQSGAQPGAAAGQAANPAPGQAGHQAANPAANPAATPAPNSHPNPAASQAANQAANSAANPAPNQTANPAASQAANQAPTPGAHPASGAAANPATPQGASPGGGALSAGPQAGGAGNAAAAARPPSPGALLLARAPLIPASELPILSPNTPLPTLSSAAQALSTVLTANTPGAAAVLTGKTPLVQSGAPDPGQLAQTLKDTVGHSGLFYESHVTDWVKGERSLADLAREPQMQRLAQGGEAAARAAGPDLSSAQMINMQLHAHEQSRVQWHGEAWPGQPMQWEIRRDQRQGGGGRQQQAEDEPQVWRSGVRFRFPLLGEVAAAVTLIGEQVHIQVQAGSGDSAQTLRAWAGRLEQALAAAGAPLASLSIGQEQPPEAASTGAEHGHG
ncbi:flagellar hook-length control protein FliK [Oxalobacteraceae bacterium A2-2]